LIVWSSIEAQDIFGSGAFSSAHHIPQNVPIDRYLPSNVPHIVDLQRTTAQAVETRIDEAMQRMQIAVSDSYDDVSAFSIYWKSDDTGGAEDSSLFIHTLSKLQNVQSCQ
jgi:hypothetical protein